MMPSGDTRQNKAVPTSPRDPRGGAGDGLPKAGAKAPGKDRVCVGEIGAPHGVRGLVRLKSFTEDPAAIAAFGPLENEAGTKTFAITIKGTVRDQFIAAVAGVADRDQADLLKRTRLYVDRARLAELADDDEFYQADLIGLGVVLVDGTRFGKVVAVHDFGAGIVLEVARPGQSSIMLPFTKQVVPTVNVAAGRIEVALPEGLLGPDNPDEDEDTGEEGGAA